MRVLLLVSLVVAVSGCKDSATDDSAVEPAYHTADPVEPSGPCPDLSESGTIEFTSLGVERKALFHLPEVVQPDMPVLFVWHGLGDTGSYIDSGLQAQLLAEQEEAVVVVPVASGAYLFEWDFIGEGEEDLAVYDDLRACLYEQHEVDLDRVYSTGFSAGALWTAFLAIERSDTLATILSFSGGTGSIVEYQALDAQIPAMLAHGGTSDEWGSPPYYVHFDETTLEFSQQLQDDGHYVVECDHGRGHNLPSEGRSMIREWVFPHVYGRPSPFEEGGLDVFPDYCAVP